ARRARDQDLLHRGHADDGGRWLLPHVGRDGSLDQGHDAGGRRAHPHGAPETRGQVAVGNGTARPRRTASLVPAAQRVIITGASSGIGAALARHYARPGAVLGLIARLEPALRALAASLAAECRIYPLDV